MQTRRTHLRRITRVDLNNGNSRSLSFIENHALELVEAPRVMQPSLGTAQSLICSLPDARQVLKGDSRLRLLRFIYNVFRYCVVDVFGCSRFFSRKPFQDSPAVLASRMLTVASLRLQRLANLVSFDSVGIKSFAAENLSGGNSSDVLHAQVDAEHSLRLRWFRRIFVDLNVKEVSVKFLAELRRCWFLVSKRITLILADVKKKLRATMQKCQAHKIIGFFVGKDSGIIINRGWTEHRVFLCSKTNRNTGNSTNGKVGGKSKLLTHSSVTTVMQLELIRDFLFLSVPRNIIARIGKHFQALLDVFYLSGNSLQFAGYGSYGNHTFNLLQNFTKVKDGIPPPAKAGGFLPIIL